MQIIKFNGKDVLVSDVKEWEKFRDWVANTSLFHAILQLSGNPDARIEAFTEEEFLSLNLNTHRVDKVEDLPIEMLAKFFQNYPDNHLFSITKPNLINQNAEGHNNQIQKDV